MVLCGIKRKFVQNVLHMKRVLIFLVAVVAMSVGMAAMDGDGGRSCAAGNEGRVLPVTGTFINLPYQDVRNRYTNPQDIDCTSPALWYSKVAEMYEMGMEYLIFMSVANEQKAYYPSKLMEWHYPQWRKSPVDAVMDAAAEYGMKVFMSTGWAKDQDDNLRDPAIKGRQIEMMEELAAMYGNHPAFHGWYLPVEDCLGPVLTDYAVEAVNALTARARELTPSAKILISPYGIFNSDFDDPRYEQQLSRLEVDIIAYQDEIGCVRERYPLPRLRENWKKLRAIHDRTGVEMWANCESFAWDKNTNDRSSALVPASYSRFLAQQVAASEGGAEKIISFIFCGLVESPSAAVALGEQTWSQEFYRDYMDWRAGDRYWKAAELGFRGELRYYDAPESVRAMASEDPSDEGWTVYGPGTHEIVVEVEGITDEVVVRMLNSHKDGIVPPQKISLYTGNGPDGDFCLQQVKYTPVWPHTRHDTFVDIVLFELDDIEDPFIKIVFSTDSKVCLDKIFNDVRL